MTPEELEALAGRALSEDPTYQLEREIHFTLRGHDPHEYGIPARRLLTSLDAALQLIPSGMRVSMVVGENYSSAEVLQGWGRARERCIVPTIERPDNNIAVVVAAAGLRARAQVMRNGGAEWGCGMKDVKPSEDPKSVIERMEALGWRFECFILDDGTLSAEAIKLPTPTPSIAPVIAYNTDPVFRVDAAKCRDAYEADWEAMQ